MGYNKRNDEINAITKESIAFAYCELLQNEQNISVTMICEKSRSVTQCLLPQLQFHR